jgi:phosphatidylglycerophosphate synthase
MLVGLWVIRDVGMFGSAYWMVRRETLRNQNNSDSVSNIAIMDPLNTPLKVQASLMSKVNTTLQIGLIALGIAGDVPAIHIPPELMTSLIWVTAGTTIVSTLGYLDGSALKNSGNR